MFFLLWPFFPAPKRLQRRDDLPLLTGRLPPLGCLIQAGRVRDRRPVDMRALFDTKPLRISLNDCPGKKGTCDARIASDLPPVWGDLPIVRQVVVNLINNAFKFLGMNMWKSGSNGQGTTPTPASTAMKGPVLALLLTNESSSVRLAKFRCNHDITATQFFLYNGEP